MMLLAASAARNTMAAACSSGPAILPRLKRSTGRERPVRARPARRPGLRAIWLQRYDGVEPAFARALAERAGLLAGDLRPTIQAAMFNAALRAAVPALRLAHRRDPPRPDGRTAGADGDAARGAGVAAEGVG